MKTEEMRRRLGEELSYLDTEAGRLAGARDQLTHALAALTRPEEVCIHNLRAREFRQGGRDKESNGNDIIFFFRD